MPGLAQAQQLTARAAQVGFDWPEAAGARAKIREELAELDRAIAAGDRGEIEHELGVIEMDYGRSEYIPLEKLKSENYELWREAVQGGIHAGIDMRAFRRTVCGAIDRIVEQSPRQRVAITCHGGVVNAWAGEILGVETPFFFEPVYTSVSRFLVSSSGKRSLVSLNETAHLRPGEETPKRG